MFEEFALPDFLLEAIAEQGWNEPTPVQSAVIPKALEGADILGGAPTGTGKSAAFLLPIISRLATRERTSAQAVILEPTRELALQVAAVAEKLLSKQEQIIASRSGELREPISCGTLIGGEDRVKQRENMPTLIAATPGRLVEFLKKGWLDSSSVEILVIDEADRMLDMGFRDEVAQVTRALDQRFQTMLFSATLEGFGVRDFAKNVLNEPCEVKIGDGDAEEKLPELLSSRAYYAANEEQKLKILMHLLNTVKGRTIVFVRTKDNLAKLSSFLKRQGMSFASLKGESSQLERKAALRRFSDGEVSLMLATDVASRGLDLPDVDFVYNYDLPHRGEIYVHRAGRTARAGAKGVVASFVLADEFEILAKIERYTERPIERRSIKGLCASFEEVGAVRQSEKKRGRAAPGGGFDKKRPGEDDKKNRVKIRERVKKNKGKPDFAAKRAKKLAREQSKQAKLSQSGVAANVASTDTASQS